MYWAVWMLVWHIYIYIYIYIYISVLFFLSLSPALYIIICQLPFLPESNPVKCASYVPIYLHNVCYLAENECIYMFSYLRYLLLSLFGNGSEIYMLTTIYFFSFFLCFHWKICYYFSCNFLEVKVVILLKK